MEFTREIYESTISELFSRHPSVQNTGFGPGSYKAGIDGMLAFGRRLGSPWEKYPTIHVAGTNGKGSVSSMLAAALSARGLRCGLYTSPHLVDFRERIKIVSRAGFEEISREEVLAFLQDNDTEGLSFFEITTGMALDWFARKEVDAAVIETGLGGRLDSTNVVTPEISIITSIGLDHCQLLGNTRPQVAFEKAGIFKKGAKALVWGRDKETSEVFAGSAARIGAQLHFANEMESGIDEDSLLEKMDLKGPCQKTNLHTVLCALMLLEGGPLGSAANPERPATAEEGPLGSAGNPEQHAIAAAEPELDAIAATAAITGLRGRWETLMEEPRVLADIAHNPPALEINFRRLRELNRQTAIVYGVMADKDLASIVPLMPSEATYYLCAPANPRSLGVERLVETLSRMRPELKLRSFSSVAEAVDSAIRDTPPEGIVYIGGSTFVVSEAVSCVESIRTGEPFAR